MRESRKADDVHRSHTCLCGEPLTESRTKPRRWCSDACRVKGARWRKAWDEAEEVLSMLDDSSAAIVRALFTHHEIAAARRRWDYVNAGGHRYRLRAVN